MSDRDRFALIQKQCRHISRWIEEAERATDIAKAERLYLKAREQICAVADAVKSGLAHMDIPKAA
ncbi:MAG: hypothetical protein A3G18_12405 [Rhodospirillales bacterium RIFCSPLOWO2_12_FULL_58_28]|nr:MAG: hypothetical protein A3H92_12420 [Rhodospirillales bacterium RIFCSPLOWO2_02_FULL_58_16]OHC79662.1 MAG: hypothetical protein A3G18_12405 [Rhodospirillales bacterium RIFCSPLOWO2_12_FULL_58_28]